MATINVTQANGKMIALEGQIETIATQLRLLPPSQKILVLPSIRESLPDEAEDIAFDARRFIRSVHSIFSERIENAQSFLQSSTSAHPKLVLMNGGSASATATCITKICEKVTHGDMEKAETLFKNIVGGGVHDLMKENSMHEKGKGFSITHLEIAPVNDELQGSHNDIVSQDVPIDELSLAADPPFPSPGHPGVKRLSQLSSVLEPILIRLAQPTEDRLAGQVHHSTSSFEDVEPAKDTSLLTPQSHGKTRTTSPLSSDFQKKLSAFGPWRGELSTPPAAKIMYSRFLATDTDDEADEEEYRFDPDLSSLVDDFCSSAPPTPGNVVFGQAFFVDMQPPQVNSVNTTNSIDACGASTSNLQEAKLRSLELKHARSESTLLRRPVSFDGCTTVLSSTQDFKEHPKNPCERPSKFSLDVTQRPSSLPLVASCTARVFVDRGTDAEESVILEGSQIFEEEVLAQPFQPVFPALEDLVIEFVDTSSDNILSAIVYGYKIGIYPLLPKGALTGAPASIHSPGSSIGNDKELHLGRCASHLTAQTDDSGYDTRHEYDPYVSGRYPSTEVKTRSPGLHEWNPPRIVIAAEEAPTMSTSRPTSSGGIVGKYVTFSLLISANTISIQNMLRALLDQHLQAEKIAFSQYYHPVAPEKDKLWRPVFGSDSVMVESTTVDQILAFGCEEGVDTNLQEQLIGQVERLGMKRNGQSRSGKVNIRYLIANVMQTYTGSASEGMPWSALSDPAILASLLVPQIEAYVAANPISRFLILLYPWDHLQTVLELRKLLGSSILQIAGIVDALACEPSSVILHHKTIASTNPLSNDAVELRSKQPRIALSLIQQHESVCSHRPNLADAQNTKFTRPNVSFSKANFVLPSTATQSEISAFLTNVSRILEQKSDFYKPDAEPVMNERPPIPPIPAPAPATSNRRHRDRENNPRVPSQRSPKDLQESKVARLTSTNLPTARLAQRNYASSVTSSIRTDCTTLTTARRIQHSDATSVASSIRTNRTTFTERGRRQDKAWENFSIHEEDSDDDEYDRMILGRALAKIIPDPRQPFTLPPGGKRSSKKALKWLGLS